MMRKLLIRFMVMVFAAVLLASCGSEAFDPPGEAAPEAAAEAEVFVADEVADEGFYGGMAVVEESAPVDFDMDDAAAEAPIYEPGEIDPSLLDASPAGIDLSQRMIIRSASLSVNTMDFDETVTRIEDIISNRGGFIESSSRHTVAYRGRQDINPYTGIVVLWRGEFTLRVPAGLFDVTNQELTALGQVRYFSTSSVDATREFNDIGSRLQIREAEEERVQRMLDDARRLADIITLEARLTDLRLVIDSYRRRMQEIDQLATFSTIRLSVFEVVSFDEDYEPEDEEEDESVGFLAGIGGAFMASARFTGQALEFIAVFIATIILPVGLIAVVGFAVYVILKKSGMGKWIAQIWDNPQ